MAPLEAACRAACRADLSGRPQFRLPEAQQALEAVINDDWEAYARIARAVLSAVQYETTDDPDYETSTDRWRFNDRINAILSA